MSTYYNENDAQKAAWLRELIRENVIAPGEVDERSITEIRPDDLRGFKQCHFFAGIGVWSYALRLAGWPDDRECWTGSCPCQSFSCAGKQRGFDDPRHLWPHWFRLIRECNPPVIFGEQVSAAIGRAFVEDEDVPQMQDRAATLRVLYELQRESGCSVQVLRPKIREDSEEGEPAEDKCGVLGMETEEARFCLSDGSEGPGEAEGLGVRSGPGEHSGAYRGGMLRTDRDTVRSDDAESVERAVTGPYHSIRRVHACECTCSPLFPECDGECVGGWSDSGDLAGDCGTTQEAIERLSELLGIGTDEELNYGWLDAIQVDLEAQNYTLGRSVLGACSVGAPHIRQRLYFCAHAENSDRRRTTRAENGRRRGSQVGRCDDVGGNNNANSDGRKTGRRLHAEYDGAMPVRGRDAGNGDQSERPGLERLSGHERNRRGPGWLDQNAARSIAEAGATRGFWSDCDWWYGRDGKYRPIEPGLFPLAHGATNRVLKLRGFGDAIVPQIAAEFIASVAEVIT